MLAFFICCKIHFTKSYLTSLKPYILLGVLFNFYFNLTRFTHVYIIELFLRVYYTYIQKYLLDIFAPCLCVYMCTLYVYYLFKYNTSMSINYEIVLVIVICTKQYNEVLHTALHTFIAPSRRSAIILRTHLCALAFMYVSVCICD